MRMLSHWLFYAVMFMNQGGIDKLGNTVIVNPGPLFNGYYANVSVHEDGTVNAELNKL